MDVEELLRKVKEGSMSIEEAMKELRHLPFKDIGFAKIDFHRRLRRGIPEVIYAPGKTKEQIRKMLGQRRKWKKRYRELDDRETLLFLHAVGSSKKDMIFHEAPAIVFILAEDGIFYDEACACAAQNMMLAAHSMGIGSCWIGFAKFLEMSGMMKEMGMPDNHHISACITLGYARNMPKPAPRKPTADVIRWVE